MNSSSDWLEAGTNIVDTALSDYRMHVYTNYSRHFKCLLSKVA